MVRTLKSKPENETAPVPTVPKRNKGKKEDDVSIFRSPHPGLQVIVKPCERIDYGAGSYEVKAPGIAEFENMGSYGECKCGPEVAEVLRQKAADRAKRKLPMKYTEV